VATYHQSDLASVARCMAELGYSRAGMPMATNSGATYGTVIHHCVMAYEQQLHFGQTKRDALRIALENWIFYWHPQNVEALCEWPGPNDWLRGHSFSLLRDKGITTLRGYADLQAPDDTNLLALEYGFQVPIPGTWDEDLGEPHILAGSIDRLGTAFWRRQLMVRADDYKSGKDYVYLRANLQGTAYCLATTLPEFWTGWRGEDGFGRERGMQLYEQLHGKARKFTWINLSKLKFEDGGWRGPKDYARFALAVEQFHALVKADAYPMSISGATCRWCSARSVCGGTGLPEDEHGKPDNTN
jgi:hypothetical protein